MPNLTGYAETTDPNWIQVQFDDGSSQHVQDPTGTYRKEVNEVATKLGFQKPDTMANAVAGPGGGDQLAGNSLAMPATAPISPTEAAPMQVSAADRAVLEGKAPVPTPSMVSPAEQRALSPNPADLAGIRRGLGDATHSPAGTASLEGNSLAMPAPVMGQPLAGNQLAMPAPANAPPLPSPTAPVLDLDSLPPIDRGGVRQGLAAQEAEHQHGLMAGQSQQQAQAERERQAAEAAARAGSAEGPSMFMSPGTGPQVTTETSRTSTGLAGADRTKVDSANLAGIEARDKANQADLIARTQQVNAEWGRLSLEQKQKLAEQAVLAQQQRDYDTKVAAKTKELEDITSRKVDPGQAFAGDAQWYAFMAGFGDSLQNFGAALAGRGPVANPGQTIDRIINRSVALQTEQKEQDFKMGRISADQLLAERETIRSKLATVGLQLSQNQLAKARTQDEKLALGAVGQKLEADRKEAIAKAAAATARHESVTGSTSTAPGTPAHASMFGGEKDNWNDVTTHYEKTAGVNMMENGLGRLEKGTGWTWDEKANNGAGGYIGKDGKLVTAETASVPGVSFVGETPQFLAGEAGREIQGGIGDLAAGDAKLKDPVGALSDKGVAVSKETIAATTDAGLLRAMERTRRGLRKARADLDAAFSPGIVNASRLRIRQETQHQNSQPGLPPSRAPRPDEL